MKLMIMAVVVMMMTGCFLPMTDSVKNANGKCYNVGYANGRMDNPTSMSEDRECARWNRQHNEREQYNAAEEYRERELNRSQE